MRFLEPVAAAPVSLPGGGVGAPSVSAGEGAAGYKRRAVRVLALTAAIALMSAADLYITLVYLKSGGMSEGNPLARWVMATGSAGALAGWKLVSVGVAC